MDIRLFFRVVRRFKVIVVAGVVIAAAAAFFSYAKVDGTGVHYRTPQLWSSTARVLIAPEKNYAIGDGPDVRSLVPLYASLASSDAVRLAAFERHKIRGAISASGSFDKNTQASLPILDVSGIAQTPRQAAVLASDGVAALDAYIVKKEATKPESQRIHLQYLNAPNPGLVALASPRSKTRPIMVFVLGIAATLALILVLENVRPQLRDARTEAVDRAA